MGRTVIAESYWLYRFILIVGGVVGNIVVRGLFSTSLGILFINPLAMISSLTGIAFLIVQYLP